LAQLATDAAQPAVLGIAIAPLPNDDRIKVRLDGRRPGSHMSTAAEV
jgi:hypothetical protein